MKRLSLPDALRTYDWFELTLAALFVAIAVFSLFCMGSLMMASFSESRSVPKSSCSSEATGARRQQTYYVQQCAAFNSDGTCSVSISIPQTYDQAEFSTVCSFKEWK